MWRTGHIELPDYSAEYKNFEYTRTPLNLEEERAWKCGDYPNMTFGGEMYNNKNYIPNWAYTLAQTLNLSRCGFTFYRMPSNTIIPTHVDHYSVYTKVFNVPVSSVVRAVIFLEDQKPGHKFEIGSTSIEDWKQGDYVMWSHEEPHSVANYSSDDRYTLQITGVKNVSS